MFTIKDVAMLLGISEVTVRRHIYKGHIRTVRFGREYKIPKEELMRIRNEGFPPDLT